MKPERKPTNLQDLRNKEQNGLKSMDHNRQLNAQKKTCYANEVINYINDCIY